VDVPGPKCRWRADWKRRRHPNRQDRLDAIKQCGTSPDRTCVSSSGDLVGQCGTQKSLGVGRRWIHPGTPQPTTRQGGRHHGPGRSGLRTRTTWCRSMTLRTLTCLRLAPASGHSNTVNPNLRASARRVIQSVPCRRTTRGRESGSPRPAPRTGNGILGEREAQDGLFHLEAGPNARGRSSRSLRSAPMTNCVAQHMARCRVTMHSCWRVFSA
jgi:hypothetical protein